MKKSKVSTAVRRELADALGRLQKSMNGPNAVVLGALGQQVNADDPLEFTCRIVDGEVTVTSGTVKYKLKD